MTRLLWMDFETDGYADNDPNVCGVLEVAWCVTDMNLVPLGDVESTLIDPRSTLDVGLSRRETVNVMQMRAPRVVRDMHTDNGLWEEASRHDTPMMRRDSVEYAVMSTILRHCEGHDTHLAGAGVGPFDMQLVRRLMPSVKRRLHYAPYDISAYRRFVENLQGRELPMPERPDVAHRALHDVEYAIDCARLWKGQADD